MKTALPVTTLQNGVSKILPFKLGKKQREVIRYTTNCKHEAKSQSTIYQRWGKQNKTLLSFQHSSRSLFYVLNFRSLLSFSPR